MNDDMDQKLRALDDVAAPDQWSDIAARATGPEVHSLLSEAPRSRSRLLVAAAVVLVLVIGAGVLAATRSDDTADVATDDGLVSVPTDPPDQIWGRVWLLETLTIDGEQIAVAPSLGGVSPRLDLTKEGKATLSGCNGGSAPVGIHGDWLGLGPGGPSTRRECSFDIDGEIWGLLAADPTIELRGDELVLVSPNAVGTFHAADATGRRTLDPPEDIWGRSWVVDRVATAEGDFVFDEDVVLDLTTEGTVLYSGCNSGSGPASLDADRLVMADGGGWTYKYCYGTVDDPVVGALLAGVTVELRGNQLTLTGGDTVIELADESWAAERDAPDQVRGRSWKVESVRTGSGDLEMPTTWPISIGLAEHGTLVFWSCQIPEVPASIEGDRLLAPTLEVVDQPDPPGCGNEQVREAVDQELAATLRGGPTIDLQGDRLKLTLGATVIRLVSER